MRQLFMELHTMLPRFLGLVSLLIFPCLAVAEGEPREPGNLPPQVGLATAAEKDGAIQLQVAIPRMIPYQVTRVVEVWDGKQVTKTFTRYKSVMEETTLTVDGKDVQVTRKDGRSVKPKNLPKLLSKKTRVLVFARTEWFDEVDPYYLQVVDRRVLIITVPPGKVFTPEPKKRD
jgi:hypothetical protein